jgi:L-aspartate oxidase
VGVVRNGPDLRLALARIAVLEAAHGNSPSFLNMCATATLITAGALMREESRGAHERLDFPDTDPGPGKRSFMKLSEALDLRAQCASEIDFTEIDLRGIDPKKENA